MISASLNFLYSAAACSVFSGSSTNLTGLSVPHSILRPGGCTSHTLHLGRMTQRLLEAFGTAQSED